MCTAVASPVEHLDLYGHAHDTMSQNGIPILLIWAISELVQHLDVSSDGPDLYSSESFAP